MYRIVIFCTVLHCQRPLTNSSGIWLVHYVTQPQRGHCFTHRRCFSIGMTSVTYHSDRFGSSKGCENVMQKGCETGLERLQSCGVERMRNRGVHAGVDRDGAAKDIEGDNVWVIVQVQKSWLIMYVQVLVQDARFELVIRLINVLLFLILMILKIS